MRVSILASGSGGNACVVESGRTRVLVDAGLSARELERRLLARGIEPETVRALFVTHEHNDHSSGALVFSARWECPVFATSGTAAAMDLARYLKLPFMGTAGASEAKRVDAQAGAEAALQVILSALSGAQIVHDAGFLDCADIGSLAYLVLVDEIIGMAKRVMRGIPVSAETILLDLIEKVGPGGTFINQSKSAAVSRRARFRIWVVFPHPSIPSNVMKCPMSRLQN